jgi:hypothetical protein
MEAGQSQPPAPPPEPSPPPSAAAGTERAGAGRRVVAGVLVLLLAFAGAVMIAVAFDLADGPRCEQIAVGECFDVSETTQTVGVILLFASGLSAVLAVGLGIYFMFRARGGRAMAIAAGAAIVLGAIALAVA